MPPDSAAEQSVPSAPGKSPTAAALLRRLLSKPDNAYRLREPELVPVGGEAVLRAVAKLIAASDTGAVFPVHPQLNPGGLERRVLRQLKYEASQAAELQVRTLLDALERAELIVRSDDGVRLKLPPERAVVVPAIGGVGERVPDIPNTLGTNTHLSAEQARLKQRAMEEGRAAFAAGDVAGLVAAWERIFAVQPNLRKKWQTWPGKARTAPMQPAFMLTIPGGAARATPAAADIQIQYGRDIGGASTADIDISGGADLRSDIGGSRAADDDDDSVFISKPESSSSSPREDMPPGDIAPADIEPGVASAAISDIAAEHGRLFAASIGKPEQAELLAREVDRLMAAQPEKAHLMPQLVARVGRLYSGGDHVNSPTALLRTMYHKERLRPGDGAGGAAAALPAGPARSKAVDPRIAAEPAWAEQPADVQKVLTTVLDELERLGPKPGAKSWVKHFAAEGHTGFRLAAVKHPELRQIADVGWTAYLEERTSDVPAQ